MELELNQTTNKLSRTINRMRMCIAFKKYPKSKLSIQVCLSYWQRAFKLLSLSLENTSNKDRVLIFNTLYF